MKIDKQEIDPTNLRPGHGSLHKWHASMPMGTSTSELLVARIIDPWRPKAKPTMLYPETTNSALALGVKRTTPRFPASEAAT